MGLPAVVSPTTRASPDAPGRRRQPPCAGALHQGRLVARSGRVPQAAASRTPRTLRLPNRPGPAGCRFDGVGDGRLYLPHLEPAPRGVVEVAVGAGHRLKQLGGPLRPRVGGQHGDDLKLGVEGDPGDFFAYQQRVFHPLAGLLPPVPGPTACEQAQGRADAESAAFHISPSCTTGSPSGPRQRAAAEDGHRHAVSCRGLVW